MMAELIGLFHLQHGTVLQKVCSTLAWSRNLDSSMVTMVAQKFINSLCHFLPHHKEKSSLSQQINEVATIRITSADCTEQYN
jgi:hypothetical protein